MGRLVSLCDSFQASTSSDSTYVAKYMPRADVSWRAAWFSQWRSPFQPEATAGNLDGGEVQVLVDGTAVFEMRVHGQISSNRHFYCVVLPWGDGLTFNEGQTLGWFLSNWTTQAIVSGGFLGERT